MIIDTVEISNLGLWENLFLKFDKSINIIQGEWGWENNFTCTIVFIISRFWNNQIYE